MICYVATPLCAFNVTSINRCINKVRQEFLSYLYHSTFIFQRIFLRTYSYTYILRTHRKQIAHYSFVGILPSTAEPIKMKIISRIFCVDLLNRINKNWTEDLMDFSILACRGWNLKKKTTHPNKLISSFKWMFTSITNLNENKVILSCRASEF